MSIETGQKYPKSRKLVKVDGTIAYTWDGKLHNWDGPALIPEGNTKQEYIYRYQQIKKIGKIYTRGEGIPFYKNQSMKNQLSDYRN